MRYIAIILILVQCAIVQGQSQTKRVLFLGNSYTEVNNLPEMVAEMATSMGDELIYDKNTPGGQTFQGHTTNSTTLSKIAVGNWDYVVLQEQSQRPSFSDGYVENSVFPYAAQLDQLITSQNPCAETVFYMTWGRKNGDSSNCTNWPPVCTYEGMDALLDLRYRMMAELNEAILSPVGAVWKYIRANHPSIELYQSDESHPSVAGTYAAACTFYAVLYRKDPMLISYNSSLSATDAGIIRAAARQVVYNNLLEWHVGDYDPISEFSYTISNGNQVTFTNQSVNGMDFEWNFGDGTNSTEQNPMHSYSAVGSYTIALTAKKCGISSTSYETVNITSLGIKEMNSVEAIKIYPNPVVYELYVGYESSSQLAYKIYDLSGKEVQTGELTKKVNVSGLVEGVYVLQLFENGQTIGQQKFVKRKSQ